MLITKSIEQLGKYVHFLGLAFSRPDKWRIFWRRLLMELDTLGVGSLGIVSIISLFVGAVMTIQSALNLDNPFIPKYMCAYVAREAILLEFSATIVCLILAGKVGSNIASEIGTMRITEQIDALDIMGVNSVSYLATPKIMAMVIGVPILVMYSICIAMIGGWLSGITTGLLSTEDFVQGIHFSFKPFYIYYSLIKSTFFGFFISSIAAFCGYYAKGSSLEVGKASTRAVVASSITILTFNVLITQIL